MNNSSLPKQSTNISNPYQPPKVELEENLTRRPLDIIEKQENKNEMNKKTKNDKTCKQHRKKEKRKK
jgi:hypothetical protein